MLCKRTMRAALLAPVIGLLGAFGAMTASAEIDLNLPSAATSAQKAANAALGFASESLVSTGCLNVGTRCFGYTVTASVGELVITANTDTLMPDGVYYLRYDLTGATFRSSLGDGAVSGRAGDSTDIQDRADITEAVAYKGGRGDSSAIFQLTDDDNGYALNYEFSIDLSGSARVEDTDGVGGVDSGKDELLSNVFVNGPGTVTMKVAAYDSIQSAKAGTSAIFSAMGPIISVRAATTTPKVTAMVDVADVATIDEDGGPFRRFIPTAQADGTGGMGGKDSGVLAKLEVGFNTGRSKLRDATTNADATDALIAKTEVTVTSDAGNFAVGTKDGGLIVGEDATNKNPWMVAAAPECKGGPLNLDVVGGDIAMYDTDPDGDDGPLKKGDLTPAGIASANKASGDAENKVGTNYFCVLVNGNTDPIPEIGDPVMKNAYMLTAHVKLAETTTVKRPFGPAISAAMAAGAIDRNGTTVHVTYLSTHEAYNQRLVLVNRGGDEAKFWVDSFNLEDGTTPMKNDLSSDMDLSIPANGRLVIRVQDKITFEGMTRGAATVNVAAPTRDIDVMTIQVHPGTGQIDTTIYQNE